MRFIIPYLGFIIALVIFTRYKSRGGSYFHLLATWLVLQNFIAMPLSKVVSSSALKVFLVGNEVFILLSLVLYYLTHQGAFRIYLVDLAALAFVFYCSSCLLLHNSGSAYIDIIALRMLILPFELYLFGRVLNLKVAEHRQVVRYLVILAVSISLFGFLERDVLPKNFWAKYGFMEYNKAKGLSWYWLQKDDQVPGSFFTYPLGTDYRVRRLVSFFADATLAGHFLSFPLLFLIFLGGSIIHNKILLWITRLIVSLGLILTICRGGILVVLLGIMLVMLQKRAMLMASAGVICLAIFLLTGIPQMFFSDNSVKNHLAGLKEGVNSVLEAPLGHGLGTAGNFPRELGDDKRSIEVRESYLGNLVHQLGVPAFLLWLIFWAFIAHAFYKPKISRSLYPYAQALGAGILCTALAAVFSESAFALTASGLYLIMVGSLVGSIKMRYSISVNGKAYGILSQR